MGTAKVIAVVCNSQPLWRRRATASEALAILRLPLGARTAIVDAIEQTDLEVQREVASVAWGAVASRDLVDGWIAGKAATLAAAHCPLPGMPPELTLPVYLTKLLGFPERPGRPSVFRMAIWLIRARPYVIGEIQVRLQRHVGGHAAVVRLLTAPLVDEAAEQRLRSRIRDLVDERLSDELERLRRIVRGKHLSRGLRTFLDASDGAWSGDHDDDDRKGHDGLTIDHVLRTLAKDYGGEPLEILARALDGELDIAPLAIARDVQNERDSYMRERRLSRWNCERCGFESAERFTTCSGCGTAHTSTAMMVQEKPIDPSDLESELKVPSEDPSAEDLMIDKELVSRLDHVRLTPRERRALRLLLGGGLERIDVYERLVLGPEAGRKFFQRLGAKLEKHPDFRALFGRSKRS